MIKNVLITGSQGFIGSYICNELLANGYKVIGIDNYSKYGKIHRAHDDNPYFTFIYGDMRDSEFLNTIPSILNNEKIDCIIACAAMIGGISYFHKFPYDLLAHNERVIANTYDFAIKNKIDRVIVLSSSMVYENSDIFPSSEEDLKKCLPPFSSYGFQKLSTEYFAKAAWDQYKIKYTIIRPFNCVGVGEDKSISEEKVISGNIELMMSHVLPDLINKVIKGQYPVRIFGKGDQVRCYTNGKDIAKGIRLALESKEAENNDFNISIKTPTTVLELLNIVWGKINPNKELKIITEASYKYDVPFRLPDTTKAKNILGFEANITIEESVDEVIDWIVKHA